MTPSEFKQIKELRQIDDQGISPDIKVLLETETESVYAVLSQIRSWVLSEVENSLTPVGAPIFWPNDQIPQGYAKINDGFSFNVIQYPQLALAWPSGNIPPHKGLVIECTADGETTGNVLSGEIKSHRHASVQKKINLNGAFKANTNSELDLPVRSGDDGSQIVSPAWCGDSINLGNTAKASVQTIVDVNVSFQDVDVTTETKETGSTRNTVDRINYNVIVRLA